jgi:site-specific DNA-methyltransferase (adenine-specific)
VTEIAGFSLKNRNPDVLTSIANLSNDEVFTPPSFANQMLDTIAEAWAKNNKGANIWEDKTVSFLDPFTKSGVFLREITRRLSKGLEKQIPDVQERVNHILTKQVFGVAITELTALLARRSLYCSKFANGEHSICTEFDTPEGNIWFERTEHTWVGGKEKVITVDDNGKEIEVTLDGTCKFCGAKQKEYERGLDAESHAYALIHTDDPKTWVKNTFGEDMQFDVIVGNPPYQLGSNGGTRDVPIYQNFVDQAIKLNPRLLTMVIPSRWMAGGLGLGAFRKAMLADRRIRRISDFSDVQDVFPGITLTGGVCYFLWDRDNPGLCDYSYNRDGKELGRAERELDTYDILVRDVRTIPILEKIIGKNESRMSEILSSRTAFGLLSNFFGYHLEKKSDQDLRFFATSPTGRIQAWVTPDKPSHNLDKIWRWKAFVPEARGPEALPDRVLGKPFIGPPGSVSTQSFLFVSTETADEAESVLSYYTTKFLRFLVLMRKISQHTNKETYAWVPVQVWDRIWTDEALYAKYKLDQGEIDFIESMIRPMDTNDV